MTAGKIYTGTIIEKYAGALDKNEIGIVIAISRGHDGGRIYKVLVDNEYKNWHGEFVRKAKEEKNKNAA
jgi:hypothetical protein